jgi:hypothetical protein
MGSDKQRKNIPRSPGRPKGSANKVTAAIKDMIVQALNEAGGVAYLVQQSEENPAAFMTLVGKVIPLQVNSNVDFVDRTAAVQRASEEVRALFGERPDDGAGDHGRGLPH